ncbi:MAG: polysaccharide deacetylase family protein [Lentisphaerae bacterium]|nr:polysaccharide deacetylase family protein [Lentisphaerota bacterium]MBT4815759.1 polysaccharide deacetylase family protein [Lentisphaerota bacterium]MBT5607675.1 polysaccharide deacetylase family protein [Lentisphaerota bacterium]MBT7055176.1 polysaccharide deacetylase family protein [Lentisphaerota bacterium]MBT7841322.1 polysaccharide deacetylase family protein [Lentisphaerota bacterium]
MDPFYLAVTTDDVGMDGYSTPEHVRNLLDLWASENLTGTLFAVPRWDGREIGASAEYVSILQHAVEQGHDVAQHGLDHTRFQTGIPPKMVLDLPHEGPAREYLANHRDEIAAAHTVDKLRHILGTGRQILEDALGVPMRGFRAPCLSTCDQLFEALEAEAYVYDSSAVFQTTAWDLINDPDRDVAPMPVTRELFEQMQTAGSMWTWPISAEYTWYLKCEHAERFLALAKHDFEACLSAGIPFVPVCHVSPVQEGDAGQGFDLYRKLMAYVRQRVVEEGKRLVSITLSQLCAEWPPNGK